VVSSVVPAPEVLLVPPLNARLKLVRWICMSSISAVIVRPVTTFSSGSTYSAASTASVSMSTLSVWPSRVTPSRFHPAGHVSVNTEPTTVLVGAATPRSDR
jgi:hypothetical protein